MNKRLALVAVATLLISPGTNAYAQGISCGTEYVTRAGDNLSKISERAYGGTRNAIQKGIDRIYEANKSVLRNRNSLDKNFPLFIPCPGDEIVTPDDADILSYKVKRKARLGFLTGSAFPPFSDLRYPEGGMFPAIARRISENIAPDSSSIDFVNDWSSHLETLLLERRAFDAAFPWYKPNCENSERIFGDAETRCRFFYFSEPIYEVRINFYVASGTTSIPASLRDLKGLRLCRPSGYYTFDLIENQLLPTSGEDKAPYQITLSRPDAPEACFEQLLRGEVDIVSMNDLLATSSINRLDIFGKAKSVDSLAYTQTLHIIVPRSRSEASALIDRINKQIIAMRNSGELEGIKQSYLEEFTFFDG